MSEIVKLYLDGWSPTQLAERFGIHRTSVYYHLKKANVTPSRPMGRPKALTECVCEHCGKTTRIVESTPTHFVHTQTQNVEKETGRWACECGASLPNVVTVCPVCKKLRPILLPKAGR